LQRGQETGLKFIPHLFLTMLPYTTSNMPAVSTPKRTTRNITKDFVPILMKKIFIKKRSAIPNINVPLRNCIQAHKHHVQKHVASTDDTTPIVHRTVTYALWLRVPHPFAL
jgi:hypothetical protein